MFPKTPPRVHWIRREDYTSLKNCRPDPPDDLQQIHCDRPVFGDPVFLRSERLIPRALFWPGATAQATYQKGKGTCRKYGCPISKYQQLTFHFPHIPDTHHPDNATVGWGHQHPLYRWVLLTSMTHPVGFWTGSTGRNNFHSFSILIVPTILSHAVLAHLISNYLKRACATRTALQKGHCYSWEM